MSSFGGERIGFFSSAEQACGVNAPLSSGFSVHFLSSFLGLRGGGGWGWGGGCAGLLVESYFPDQVSNLYPCSASMES